MKNVLVIFGTRPEAIKLAPLVLELKKFPDNFRVTVCVTAQHREMLDQVLKIFGIQPDYDLNVTQKNQNLFDITKNILQKIEKVIEEDQPHMIIVQGDTTTTFVSSLAAFYNKLKIVHVEAGLRTFNKYSPFPEEINRRLTSVLSDYHFAPTEQARNNLLSEGISPDSIMITGNTVIDALLWVKKKVNEEKKIYEELKGIDFTKKVILVTGHRRENFGQDFINICNALKRIALTFEETEVVYPVHLNPNVQQPVYSILGNVKNVFLIKPLEYEPFVSLMDRSYMIISDSGGIQEEAPSLGKPILVTRKNTERPEAVVAGAAKLVGTEESIIFEEAKELLINRGSYNKMANVKNPFGDGMACKRIVEKLTEL